MIAETLISFAADFSVGHALLPLAALTKGATSMGWALMMFCIVLGLMITLTPSKRTSEVKRPTDD